MFLRDVLKRWNERPVDAANEAGSAATACRVAPSLLEELATDPADFVELAALLKLDVRAVTTALVRERPQTPTELVERLVAQASTVGDTAAATSESPATDPTPTPLVWARVALDRRGSIGTVYAGWLTPGAVEEIAGVAGSGGAETQVEITVALADDDARLARVRALCADVVEKLPPHLRVTSAEQRQKSSWGGGGAVGWGRWTRAHGGARVHRDSPSPAVRPAMAPS